MSASEADTDGGSGPRGTLKVVGLAGAALGIGLALFLLPVNEWLLAAVDWIRRAGALGIAAYVVLYVAGALLFLPGALVTMAAGFVYGPMVGTAIVFPTATVASTVAFLVGRFLARDWVANKVRGNAKFEAIDEAIGRSGFRIVVLLRLSPVFPYNLLNYALGLTKVRTRDYVLACGAMLPGTILYVYLGSLVTSLAELASDRRPQGGTAQTVLFWGGLVATVVVTVLLTRLARRELRKDLGVAADDGVNAP